ncbi:hypothetical protein ACTID9_12230 [Brevibacillus fluminis]|uniref:hypothetical protein n=1 Tax=Brevibacillus fluminis TaxID=511487 RepID=UPI003F8CA8BF
MKRLAFATPEELTAYCMAEEVALIIEYRDEQGKQRQVTLKGDALGDLAGYFGQRDVMAYFRKDKLFYEIKPEWLVKP